MYIAIIVLAALAELAYLLPLVLRSFFLPDLPYFWIALGQLIDAVAVTGCWLLGYLLWEKRFAREVRDGVSFWTAVGAALARLLVCAASAAAWLRGGELRTWTLLRLLLLCFQAAADVAAWRSVRQADRRLRLLWPLLIAALVLRLVSIGLALPADPILLRLPLAVAHIGLLVCLRKEA
jgi:hypothetical protein